MVTVKTSCDWTRPPAGVFVQGLVKVWKGIWFSLQLTVIDGGHCLMFNNRCIGDYLLEHAKFGNLL